MVDITDYPELDSLQDEIERAFEEAVDNFADQAPIQSGTIRRFFLDKILVSGRWGRDTATQGEHPLEIVLYADFEGRQELIGTGEELQASSLFLNVRDEIAPRANASFEPDALMLDWFSGVDMGILATTVFDDSAAFFMQEAQPNRAVNLTDRQILTLDSQGNIEREFFGAEPEPEVTPEEPEERTDIAQFPIRDGLRESLNEAFDQAVEEEFEESSPAVRDILDRIFVQRYVVVGDWGRGTATFGETPISIIVSMNLQGGEDPSFATFFDSASRRVADRMEEIIDLPFLAEQWFGGIVLTAAPSNLDEQTIVFQIQEESPPRAFDLTNEEIITIEDGRLVTQPAVPVVEEEPEPEIEIEEPEFPEVPPELRRYAREDVRMGVVAEVPAGKETKAVIPREPHEFEIELWTPGKANTDIDFEINEGIGQAILTGELGASEPAGTFPRTGLYIKWYLFFLGPAYVLEMYNNLVVYSGYISTIYGGSFRPGTYDSFRQMIYRLEQVSSRGEGPELIRSLTDEEALSLGFDITPKLPTGEDAPWLENRRYYEIVDENMDHVAWENVTAYLFGVAE